ncbi:hypothetical protein EYA84_02070 [Verrucosispora sp. SN26_14.1]|uniref:hypothetical protein n=1 Tax=Verrucosispora sp. SN26_14.1 TaxID=2527879 RepID=UPI00103346B4|nr:hypothetical protein [Verrucosispora sp. SN26_14.1]TBL44251.1 hypothetical protein EYA84_02070 [Verrucosispora sp. SN26_14.1]
MTLTSIKPGLRAAGDLPLHPTLTHPHTGAPIRALGVRRDGRLIWPALGAAPDDGGEGGGESGETEGGKPEGESGKSEGDGDKPLGPGGEKALAAEREARKALEKRIAALAPLEKLATALGGGDVDKGKTEVEQLTERLAAQERAIADERTARWRAEVQAEKKLTAVQAARLVGSSREELLADADELLAAFGGTGQDDQAGQNGARRPGMRPDPAQGARPGQKTSSLESGKSLYGERHNKKTTTTT